MILSIFIVLIIVALSVLAIGQYLSAPPIQIAGYVIGFVLGITFMLGGVTYASGETTSYDYVCGCCQNNTFVYGTINTTYQCTGTPPTCDYYDANPLDCLVAGCTYDEELSLCSGTPSECSTFTNSRDCAVVTCTWELLTTQPTGCENESLVIKTENVTTTFTNYTGEIVQGIMLHHILGWLLSLMSALGFIVVLMNLKSGFSDGSEE